MTAAVAALIAAGILLPHVVRLERVAPITAASLWACSLALRALAGLFLAIYLVFFLPATELFGALTHWCLHAVVPLVATHLGVSGHGLGDAAIVAPAGVVAVSLASAAFGVARAARAVRRLLSRSTVARGPSDSLIIGGNGVLLAAAGLTRPRLVVSAGALTQLDDEELAAGIEHERGHIARRHRYVLVAAELCRAIGRVVPGSSRAVAQLAFHLERDADRWALRCRHDRLALASAICKAATTQSKASPVFAALGGGGIAERLDQLTGAVRPVAGRRAVAMNAVAAAVVALTLGVTMTLPATVQAGVKSLQQVERARHCPS
jgi:Zn-dependent protease with chaperone function